MGNARFNGEDLSYEPSAAPGVNTVPQHWRSAEVYPILTDATVQAARGYPKSGIKLDGKKAEEIIAKHLESLESDKLSTGAIFAKRLRSAVRGIRHMAAIKLGEGETFDLKMPKAETPAGAEDTDGDAKKEADAKVQRERYADMSEALRIAGLLESVKRHIGKFNTPPQDVQDALAQMSKVLQEEIVHKFRAVNASHDRRQPASVRGPA